MIWGFFNFEMKGNSVHWKPSIDKWKKSISSIIYIEKDGNVLNCIPTAGQYGRPREWIKIMQKPTMETNEQYQQDGKSY